MLRDDDHWRDLVDAFHTAAITSDGWYTALDGLARATGSRSGELLVVGADASLPFNLMTNIDQETVIEDLLAVGGHDPRFNPRVRAGLSSPVCHVLTESDFITPDEHRRHPHYETCRRWDVPYSCLATLERTEDSVIGLTLLRSERQGHIESAGRQIFSALMPVVRGAVRTHNALADHRTALLAGVMEAMSAAAFIADRRGRVAPATGEAERLLADQRLLQLRGGRLRAPTDPETGALTDAIRRAAADPALDRPLIQTVPVRGRHESDSLLLDVIALPGEADGMTFGPRVLILARGRPETRQETSKLLQALYSLTEAETDVAMSLSAGTPLEAIAEQRGVAVGTVRAQTKSLLAKVGVNRQVELVARLGRLRLTG